MRKIIQIFDGEYGCEELVPGAKPKVSVDIINDMAEVNVKLSHRKYIS